MNEMIRYHHILPSSYVDGPGQRTVLFLQGCPIQCPGCQSQHLWASDGGQQVKVADLTVKLLAEAVESQHYPADGPAITISGGEPFCQVEALTLLVRVLRIYGAHLILYTGYTWEDLWLMAIALPEIESVLRDIQVLVDGPYIHQLDTPWMQYRGSSNQRVIDVPSSLETGDPVLLDWDRPELVITEEGKVLASEPVTRLFAQAGRSYPARRCGQT